MEEFATIPTNQSQESTETTAPSTSETVDIPAVDTDSVNEPASEPKADATPEAKEPPIKIKYNHEEVEIPYEEATTWIQKGKNYDKVNGKLAERDAEVAKRFSTQGINTWEDLLKGWDATQQRQREQALDQEYQNAVKQEAEKWGADPDTLTQIANALASKHPSVLKSQQLELENGQIKSQQQQQAQINQSATEFKAAYPSLDYSTIPQEVWDKCNKGYSLMDSYQIYENKALKEKIAAQEKAIHVKETNQNNAINSPGSVTGNGATVADYISADTFEKNKDDQRWIIKNLSKIQESRAKWK